VCVIDVALYMYMYYIRHLGRALVPWAPIWHLGRALVPWAPLCVMEPPSLNLRGWIFSTSKVVFFCHHLIVLVI
jgi:hypothetical protein